MQLCLHLMCVCDYYAKDSTLPLPPNTHTLKRVYGDSDRAQLQVPEVPEESLVLADAD